MAGCAFVGLGVMGYPMAGHLVSAGHDVTVYNRTASRAEAWVAEHGGTAAPTPAGAAADAEFVLVCVGNDDDVRSVTLGPGGVLESMSSGAVLVDHTTASADLARELHRVSKERGVGRSYHAVLCLPGVEALAGLSAQLALAHHGPQ